MDDQPDSFDPARLRLPRDFVRAGGRERAPSRKSKGGRFIKFPLSWAEQLTKARRIATYRVALRVLYLHWRSRGQPFTLANRGLETEGVGRIAKWRALGELELLGLITIERCKGRSPRITVT
jgi:hypothetical protein